jgi:hypothetical protein
MLAVYSAASVVFGAASGYALSLDCIVEQHAFLRCRLPVAIQRQLFYFIAAVVNFVAVALLLIATHWVKRGWRAATASPCRSRLHSTRSQVLAPPGVGQGSGTSLSQGSAVVPPPALGAPPQRSRQGFDYTKLLVAMPVVLFYAFPTLVKAALTFFACLRIDDASGPYPAYALASHPSGYWTADIQQECFAGVHRTWALALGVPAVLLFCVGLPVGMFVFLWVNRFKVDDPEYRKYFGFVYRNYTVSKCWWEAVWATQTVLLTAVAVFHFTLTAYNALLLLGLLLLASTVLQTVAKPYALHQLHRLHMASTLCLILNVWCALAFFSCAGPQATRAPSCFPNWNTAVGVIMVVVNIGFVVWCLYDVLISALPALQSFGKTASSVSSGVLQAASARLRLPRGRRRKPRRLLGAQRVDSDALPRLWDQIQRRCADAGADGADAEAPDGGALNGGLMPVQSAPARMAGR